MGNYKTYGLVNFLLIMNECIKKKFNFSFPKKGSNRVSLHYYYEYLGEVKICVIPVDLGTGLTCCDVVEISKDKYNILKEMFDSLGLNILNTLKPCGRIKTDHCSLKLQGKKITIKNTDNKEITFLCKYTA